MNTKEAIERIKLLYVFLFDCDFLKMLKDDRKRDMNDIIDLLKRGERFEQMWEGFKEEHGTIASMAEFEQKYFPKPIKKTITVDKDLLSDHAREINKCYREWIEDHLVRDLPITPEELAILSDSIIKGIENSVKNIKEGD